jgi:hypothetical protein
LDNESEKCKNESSGEEKEDELEREVLFEIGSSGFTGASLFDVGWQVGAEEVDDAYRK